MRADRAEVSWDAKKSEWLVRIESGEEVVRRHISAPKDADDQKLGPMIKDAVQDEGYDLDPAQIAIRR